LNTELYWEGKFLRWLLLAFAFTLPISIALAEPLAFGAFGVWVYRLIKRGAGGVSRNPYFWPVLAFSGVAIVVSVFGIRPGISIGKCHRLLILGMILMMGSEFSTRREGGWKNVIWAAVLFISACALRGVYHSIYVPVMVSRGMALFDTGNMRDPQMYLVALCFLIAGFFHKVWGRYKWVALAATLACALGLFLNFKRGAWFAFVITSMVMALVGRRMKFVLAIILCVAGVLLIPQSRERLGMLTDEWSNRQGGRYVLWMDVAPTLLKQYPQGMGLKATKHEDLTRISPRIQPNLDHLHNNVIQVRLELGWAGLLAWLWWMTTAFFVMLFSYRRLRDKDSVAAGLALGSFGAFIGLMLNGVVEYNFGDTEILMLLCFVMGLSAVVSEKVLSLSERGSS